MNITGTPSAMAQVGDTIPPPVIPGEEIRISADTLEAVVDYGSRDSILMDNANSLVFLYGEAYVQYQTFSITADKITLDLENDMAIAEKLPDSLKAEPETTLGPEQDQPQLARDTIPVEEEDYFVQDTTFGQPPSEFGDQQVQQQEGRSVKPTDGTPWFDDGEQQFAANKIRYNFKTRKGKIYNSAAQYQQLYLHGSESKFVGAGGIDTTVANDVIYNRDVLLTTCDAPHPHYGIRSSKQKLIKDRQVIVGPSVLEIANIKTPLFLPFGFFPLVKGAKNGLIFPRNYEYSQEWGFGLRNVGYYFPINDYWDLEVTGDIYFKGSWAANVKTSYKKRYRFSGNIDLGYSNRQREVFSSENGLRDISDKSYKIQWSHSQARTAHPYRTFRASVNIQTNRFDQRNFTDAGSILNNQYSSNVSWSHSLPGTPFNVSANMRHSQNTATGAVTMTLPDINLNMTRIFPLKSKNRPGSDRWYEKISLDYQGNFVNRIQTVDTLLFQEGLLKDAQYGADHSLSSSAPFRVLKYFNLIPSVSYDEAWYFSTIRKTFDPTIAVEMDTIFNPLDSSDFTVIPDTTSFGQVLTDTVRGFEALRRYSANISVNTQLFASMPWSIGRLKGVRQVIKPSMTFSLQPDYSDPTRGYVREVQRDIRPEVEWEDYSIFQGGLFPVTSLSEGSRFLSYNISSTIEGKWLSRKDSTEKKFKIFNRLDLNGSYNFSAGPDQLAWSPLSLRANTTLLKNISRVNISAGWDVYDEVNGIRVNTFYKDSEGPLLRFMGATARISSAMSVGQIRDLFTGEGQQERNRGVESGDNLSESLTDMFSRFRISHNIGINWDKIEDRDTLRITNHTINTQGAINLTPNWRINVGNIGYDFRAKRLTYPYLTFTRDLHCWEMGFSWAPVFNTYSFYLRVKQNPLDFIKIPYQKNRQDARQFIR